ncbi:hypothetical protein ABEF95_005969 [Exophiala dermatitidis]
MTVEDIGNVQSFAKSEAPSSHSLSHIESQDAVRREQVRKRAYAKVDRRLILWHMVLYLLMKFGQSNVSNAAIMNLESGNGIKKELGHLTSTQWAFVLSVFYYPYMFLEPGSGLLIKRFSPSIWISRILLTWGIASICQAATKNYAGIIACRIFLGAAEAGYWPAAVYHISFWYHPDYLPMRMGIFYAFGASAGALFLIEGTWPIIAGIITYLFLTDYPQTAKFITEEERQVILDTLPKGAPSMHDKAWDGKAVKKMLRDPTFWGFLALWVSQNIGGYGVVYVYPTVVYEMGFTGTTTTQLLTMPPYGLAWTVLLFFNLFIRHKRIPAFAVGLGIVSIQVVCYILLLTLKSAPARYVFLTIGICGTYTVSPILWSERIRAVKGTSTSGLAFGITNGMASITGIVGPQIFQSKFGPRYKVSYGICLVFLCICVVSLLGTWKLCRDKYAREAAEAEAASDSTIEIEITHKPKPEAL